MMRRSRSSKDRSGRWQNEPTPEQLHGLTGDLVTATRLYGNGVKRRLSGRGHLVYRLIPDGYVAFESSDDGEISHEVHEDISARIGLVAHRHWSLIMSERSVRRGVSGAPAPVDIFHIENADTGAVSGLFEVNPDLDEFGIRTDYIFEWKRDAVLRAERRVRVIPDSLRTDTERSGLPLDQIAYTREPDPVAGYIDPETFYYYFDHMRVSAPDVRYLRDRVRAHCQKLVSAWDDDGTRND